MPQRNRRNWNRRLRKHAKQISQSIGLRAIGSPRSVRSLGFETLEERHYLAVQPFPVPLEAVEPQASLIYTGAASAAIDFAGEMESFTISLDTPQRITLVADPSLTLQPTLEILDPSATPLANTIAAANGSKAVLQTVDVTTPGTYTINVTGAGGSAGDFSLRMFLNAALEADRVGGPANGTAATAQDVDGSFIPLGAGSAEHGAVIGLGGATGPTFSASQTHTNDVVAGNVLPFDFTGAPAPLGNATLTFTAVADLDSSSEYLTLNAEGLFSQNVFVTGGLQQQLVTAVVNIPQATLQQLAADGTISFTVTPSLSVNSLGANYLTLDLSYPIVDALGALGGWYSFSLDDGQSATIVADSATAVGLQLELYDQNGTTLLAQGFAGETGSLVIDGYTDATSDLLPATYYVRIASSNEYQLVVTRDAELESEPNNDLAPIAQDITLAGTVLGQLNAGDVGPTVSLGIVEDSLPWGRSSNSIVAAALGYNLTFIPSANLAFTDLSAFDAIILAGDQGSSTYSNVQSNLSAIEAYVSAGGVWLVNYADGSGGNTYTYDVLPGASGLVVTGVTGTNIEVLDPTSGLISGPGGTIDNTNLDNGNYSTHGYTTSSLPAGATAILSTATATQVVAFDYPFSNGHVVVHTLPVEFYNGGPHNIGQIFHRNLFHFAASFAGDVGDYYSVAAQAGDVLNVSAFVLAAGPGEFVNTLDLAVELYDPLGNLVASDAAGSLVHAATLSGDYTIRVLAESNTKGEYALSVSGQTGSLPAFVVTDSNPPDGAALLTAPNKITIELSDEVLLSSVQAADLTVNGLPASGMTIVDTNTLRFTLPPSVEGANNVAIAAGAISDLQGQSLAEFASQFTLDSTAPRAIASSILEGDTAAGGTLVYTAQFDDVLDATNLDAFDVQLIGQFSGFHAPTVFNYDALTSTLTLQYENLPEDQFSLTLFSGDGQFEDVLGRDLDGEPNVATTVPSGNGLPGGSFVVNFATDFVVASYPTPLAPVAPLGSLIYDPSINGVLGVGDTDSFTIHVDDGQTISVLVETEGSLLAEVALQSPGGAGIGAAAAGSVGDDVVLQTVPTIGAGTYTVSVSALSGTTGTYSLRIVLNAAIEEESHDGSHNNDTINAQDLDGSFVGLGFGTAERGAVLGTSDVGTGDFYRFTLAANQSTTLALSAAAGEYTLELRDAAGDLLATGTGAANVDQVIGNFVTAIGGTFYANVIGPIGDYSLVVTRDADFDVEPNNGLGQNAQDITLSGTVLGGIINGVALPGGVGTPIAGPVDVFGTPLSLGIAYDGSFVGNFLGALHNGVEYLRQGTFLAGYTVAFNGATYTNASASYGSSFLVTLEDLSSGSQHAIRARGSVTSGVEYERVVSWNEGDDYAVIYTNITNNTGAALNNLALLENHDPDPNGNFSTSNDVTSGGDLVVGSTAGVGAMALGTMDPRAVMSAEGFFVSNPFEVIGSPEDPNGGFNDIAINVAFDLGTLEAGASESTAMVMVFGASQAAVEATYAAVAAITTIGDNDAYAVQANAGDLLQISTLIPAAGPGEFVNQLDVAVELYDPLGNLVASSAAGSLTHAAALTGAYTVRVLAENSSRGEYVLNVSGHTGGLQPFEVISSSPLDGAALQTAPTQLVVDFSDSILLTSVDASDLTFGGTTATNVTIVDHDTLAFDLPALADGTHTMSIAAGALVDLQGQPLEAFSLQFSVDSTGPRVVASSVLDGGVVEAGTLTYTVSFDEALVASDLDASDVQLFGLNSGYHFPALFDYDADTLSLTLQYADLPEDDYSLTLFSYPAGFHDAAGNLLDGELNPATTVPSGDGFSGGDFSLGFVADITVGAFPVPFVPAGPLGSLIYSSGVAGRILPSSDTDAYTVNLDAGQQLSLVVAAQFQAVVTVLGPDALPLTSVSATAAGQVVLVQDVPINVAGTYTVRIESLGGTFGNYTIDAVLNAHVEEESHGGPANNDAATAEDIDGSFVELGSGNADRSGIVGEGGPNQGPNYSESQTQSNVVFFPNVLTYNFLNALTPLGDATLTLSAIADLDASSEFLTVSAEGLFSQNVFVSGGQQQQLVTAQINIPLATLAQLAADGTISFTVTPSSSVNNLGSNSLTLDLSYVTAGGSGDWYQFTLEDHESATVVLSAGDFGNVVELYDASGTTRLASGVRASNGLTVIQNFVDRTADGLPDTYFVRAFVLDPEYQLAITRDADFDVEGDDSFDDAQDIGGINNVLGYLDGSSDEDWHQISVNSGDLLTVTATAPGSGPFEFVNPMGQGLTGGLIISEVVDGTVVDGNPKFVEITNTGNTPFTFAAGGLIVQSNNSADHAVDVDLTGVTILAGQSYVIATSANDGQTIFEETYGFAADLYVDALLGDGNDRFSLTDTANGSHLLDTYGVLNTNGTGQPWEYTDSYAYRTSFAVSPTGAAFNAGDWFIAGANALETGNDVSETLLLQTLTTPGTHNFVPGDTPLVRVELYDPTGALVEPAALALSHAAALTGNYRLRVISLDRSGEYFVAVDGATGMNNPPTVVDASPEDGALFNQFPTSYSLTFSEPLLEGTLTASDLLINGLPAATGVTQVDPFTFVFDIDPAANVGDGTYTVALPVGAVEDLSGKPNEAFAATFGLDATGPRVLNVKFNGAPLPLGGNLPAGPLTIDVFFNESLREELAAGQLGPEDAYLTNQITNDVIAPTTVTYDAVLNKATLTFAAIDESIYKLTLISGDGSFEDIAGNDLDGEPWGPNQIGTPSGNGSPGGNYVVQFQTDAVGARLLEPFERLRPLGSFMAVSEGNLGVIGSPGDVDDFVIDVQSGQILSALLTADDPSATMFLSLVGVSGPVFSVTPGQPVVLPPELIPVSGPLTFRVLGDRTTTYSLDVYANAVHERLVGDSADGNELSLEDSLLTLGYGRWGAIGEVAANPSLSTIYTQDFNLGAGGFVFDNASFGSGNGLWHHSTGRQSDGKPNHSPAGSLYFGQHEDPLGNGDYDTGAATAGTATSAFIALPDVEVILVSLNYLLETDEVNGRDIAEIAVNNGSGFVTLRSTADGSLDSDTAGQWRPITIDLSQYAGQSVALRFSFDSINGTQNDLEGWFIDDLRIQAANSFLADVDEYTIDLTDHVGQPLDFVVAAQIGGNLSAATVQLLGPDGTTVLATATVDPLGIPANNFDQAILGFVPTLPGTYTLRIISDAPGEYGVLVTESLPLEGEPNDNVGSTLRNITGAHSAVGFLGGGSDGGGVATSRLFAVLNNTSQVVELDPATGAELNRFALPELAVQGAEALAFNGTSLFFAAAPQFGGGGNLYELNPDTGAIIDVDSFGSLGLGSGVDGLGVYAGLVFASDTLTSRIVFVDPTTDTPVGSVFAPVALRGGAAGAGSRGTIFVDDFLNDQIYEIDPGSGQVIHSLPVPSGSVFGLAFIGGSLFTGDFQSGQVFELDPDTGAVLNTWFGPGAISALGGDDGTGTPPVFVASSVAPPVNSGAGTQSYLPNQSFPTGGAGGATTLNVGLSVFDKDDPLASVVGSELATLALSAAGGGGIANVAQLAVTAGAMDLLQIHDDLVVIEAVASGDTNDLWQDLVGLGLQHASSFGRFVSGWLPISAIVDMSSLASLRFAQPAYKPITSVGNTTSQADLSMHADVARSLFGVDGTGITVGALSDSYNSFGSASSDVFSGDLPGTGNPLGHTTTVNVLSDIGGASDEGRAMLQLVHDVAPGAGLAFHTAFNGQADFASGILELQSIAGADVIVDDVIYFAEPMFQDGIIAQAIDTVVANGATYFSSAGNNARSSWEGAYRPSGTFLSGRQLHDFDPGAGLDTFQSATVPIGSQVLLSFQWDSPFFSVSGGSGSHNDVDFFILDSTNTTILASGTTSNLGGDALEVISFTNFSGSSQVNFAIGLSSGAAPGLMKWVGFGDPTVNQFATNSATAYGHANAAGAVAVGAADYRDTPAFGTNPPQIEFFSSAGGIPILFDTSGNPIFELRDKPQIVAPDGTNTTFFGSDVDFDGYPNFFGTSAAAPHAAALAALMQELAPIATPTEIYDAMIGSAIDMDDPATGGFDVGFDTGTGHGLIQAVDALTLIQVDPALVGPRVINVDPASGTSNDLSITKITLTFSEQLAAASANSAANYQLIEAGLNGVFDGGAGDDVVVALTPQFDGNTIVELLHGNGSTPFGFGKYRLTVDGDNSIQDLDGNPLNSISGVGGGSDFVQEFEIVFSVPSGGDFYRIDLTAGQQVTISTRTPWDDPLGSFTNDLDTQLIVYNGAGTLLAVDSNSADGKNALATFIATADGPYFVQVVAESGTGEYVLDVQTVDVMLRGDYNRDGEVDAADYSVWRNNLGSPSLPYELGDGDGNSLVEESDYAIWAANYGTNWANAREDQIIVLGGGGGGLAAVAAFEAESFSSDESVAATSASADAARADVFDAFELDFAVPEQDAIGPSFAARSRGSDHRSLFATLSNRQDLLATLLDRSDDERDADDLWSLAGERTRFDDCDEAASPEASDEFYSLLGGSRHAGGRLKQRVFG